MSISTGINKAENWVDAEDYLMLTSRFNPLRNLGLLSSTRSKTIRVLHIMLSVILLLCLSLYKTCVHIHNALRSACMCKRMKVNCACLKHTVAVMYIGWCSSHIFKVYSMALYTTGLYSHVSGWHPVYVRDKSTWNLWEVKVHKRERPFPCLQ